MARRHLRTGISLVLLTLLMCTFAGCTGADYTDPIKNLSSPDDAVQKQAIAELSLAGAPAVTPLIGVFAAGDNRSVMAAAVTLSLIGEPAIPALISELSSDDNRTREWSQTTLVLIGEPAIRPLIDELKTGSDRSKNEASVALIRIGSPAYTALQGLAFSDDAELRQRADAIIQSIILTEELREASAAAS